MLRGDLAAAVVSILMHTFRDYCIRFLLVWMLLYLYQ